LPIVFDGNAMDRRAILRALGAASIAATAGVWRPAGAQARPDREHRIALDLPILAEEPASVPIGVALDHPMEPDHHIRSITVTVDGDPVPAKGRFLFSPANGRAAVAYQMRSGTGGLVRVVAECTRHGEVTATQELRVVEGGCSTAPDPGARDRAGDPELRVPRSVRPRQPIEVRARLIHGSHTGLVLRQGKFVRQLPEYYVTRMVVWLDDQRVSEFQMTAAVSPNPLVRFPLTLTRPGTLRVEFVNSEGQRWEARQVIRL
jgi:predicted secreted protein